MTWVRGSDFKDCGIFHSDDGVLPTSRKVREKWGTLSWVGAAKSKIAKRLKPSARLDTALFLRWAGLGNDAVYEACACGATAIGGSVELISLIYRS